jgi:isoleucyl-tRNA synthetase
MSFTPAPTQLDLPALEQRVLERWERDRVFQRSLEQTAGGPLFVFYDGPPTANGKPGVHHVEPRVFKDLFCRYRTMKGEHVPRRAGWDCHGLPVELAVEKELGFSGKQQIEAYGIEEFNARCRESVLRHVAEHQELSRRMAYWVDQEDAYRTMDPEYVESVWWSIQTIFDRGLLVEDHRVAPWCPRCGTGLSDHEVAQGYATVTDPSVYVRFPLVDAPVEADLLVWTTTPWTLVSNTAVAVHPDVTYVVARLGDATLVVAEPLLERAVGEGAEVLQRLPGRDLERWRYRRPFELVEVPDAHYVTLADYVTTEDGTGLVHTAPAFGAEDLLVARRYDLPVVSPVTPQGRFEDGVPLVGGLFFKDADEPLVDDLRVRGVLWRAEPFEHSYPHCWRCDTALLYYATPSWYIRTTAVKEQLLGENERTDWHPPTIKHGRYGDWLENNIDWAVSRSRYWGTPLPIWRCADGHLTCVGSLAELGERAGRDLSGLDPHRPFVDDVTMACPECGAEATRDPSVLDCWYDAGSMPFAQWGAPHRNVDVMRERYPAHFIAEAIDQTRGWFYTLMAIGTLAFDQSSYRTVLCLGHIVDEDGRKMSKHLGNVLEPFELFARTGADPVRWLLLCVGNPWANRRVGPGAVDDVTRRVLLTYWNTLAFFTLYASTEDWRPGSEVSPPAQRPAMDRWLLSELHDTTAVVDAALAEYDPVRAGRRLTDFLDDLSNWYVRRSRRRFWRGDPSALATLHETLLHLTRLLAPFVPFLAEEAWQRLAVAVDETAPDSVHLASWPEADPELVDPVLAEQMSLARRLVELGRATRAESGVKTRQPLARALVAAAGWDDLADDVREQVAEELNVVSLGSLADEGELVEHSVKASFRSLGRRFGKDTPAVAAAIAAADAGALARALRGGGTATVEVDGTPVELTADDVVVSETPRSGWAVATEAGATVALDLEITPELRRAGLARDVVRVVQESRKSSGLDVTDRIELWWEADGDLADALAEHAERVAEEVLAVQLTRGAPPVDVAPHQDEALGLTWWLREAGR